MQVVKPGEIYFEPSDQKLLWLNLLHIYLVNGERLPGIVVTYSVGGHADHPLICRTFRILKKLSNTQEILGYTYNPYPMSVLIHSYQGTGTSTKKQPRVDELDAKKLESSTKFGLPRLFGDDTIDTGDTFLFSDRISHIDEENDRSATLVLKSHSKWIPDYAAMGMSGTTWDYFDTEVDDQFSHILADGSLPNVGNLEDYVYEASGAIRGYIPGNELRRLMALTRDEKELKIGLTVNKIREEFEKLLKDPKELRRRVPNTTKIWEELLTA